MMLFETSLFLITHVLVTLLIAIHILMNKHEEPASAVLWLFIVYSFPIVGVILYLTFGINRIKTLGLKIELANEKIKQAEKDHVLKVLDAIKAQQQQFTYQANPELATHSHFTTFDRLLPKTTALTGNHIILLHNGTTAYPKMLASIQSAKHHIHLQSFIINKDIIGKKILDALIAKAKQGVEVKVLYDKFGSLKAIFSLFFAKYTNKVHNLKIAPFAFTNLLAPWRIQLRNHRKLLVIDGTTAFIGGINISDENDIRICSKDRYIHDLHCQVSGPAVNELQFSFMRDWHYATKAPLLTIFQDKYFPRQSSQGDAIIRVINSGPGQQLSATEKTFSAAVAVANSSIWIMTPYFTPDKPFIKALIIAAARGVDVRIIVPKHNNHWYAQFASRSLYPTLLKNNISIFEKTGSFSHTKAVLIDNKWAIMGSSNCDVRSFRLNYELDFTVADTEMIAHLAKQFYHELNQSTHITLQKIKCKSFIVQLLENICSLLTPVL